MQILASSALVDAAPEHKAAPKLHSGSFLAWARQGIMCLGCASPEASS